jgi:5-methylcytosine-specific restriction protein A
MPKLKALKPRLAGLPSRMPRRANADGHSRVLEPWRNWYSLARWAALRQRVFERDCYTCQCGCETVIAKPSERIADHVEPHHGDPELFWDEDNVQTLWKPHHDGWKQRLERAARAARGVGGV